MLHMSRVSCHKCTWLMTFALFTERNHMLAVDRVSSSTGKPLAGVKGAKTPQRRKSKFKYSPRGWREGAIRTDPECLQVRYRPSLGEARCFSHIHWCEHANTPSQNGARTGGHWLFFYHSSPRCQKSLFSSCFHKWRAAKTLKMNGHTWLHVISTSCWMCGQTVEFVFL